MIPGSSNSPAVCFFVAKVMRAGISIRNWSHATGFGCVLGLAVALSAGATDTAKSTASSTGTSSKSPSTPKTSSAHKKKKTKGKGKKKGQQVIDSARAREIQEALIREHYLDGEPSGKWDAATQAAMQRYQADQGWQSKTVPDSRALIKLGLGPSSEHLLNPESAMTTRPSAVKPSSADPPAAPANTPAANNTPQ